MGGFGAKAHAIGRAVFGITLLDGEEARWDRGDIAGLAVEPTPTEPLLKALGLDSVQAFYNKVNP